MVDAGYGVPKVEIFGSRGILLYETTGPKVCEDRSLKHIIDSLRVVQRETNEFLTSLVNERSSQHPSKNDIVMDEDSADDEDEEEKNAVPKKRKQH